MIKLNNTRSKYYVDLIVKCHGLSGTIIENGWKN